MAPPAPNARPNAAAAAASPANQFAALPAAAKVLIGLIIVAGIGIVYYFALHSPLEEQLTSAHQRHRQLTQQRDEALERQREYLSLRDQLAARNGLDQQNMRVLPQNAEMASFLQELNRLAEMSGLEIRLVEPRPEEPEEQYVRLPVALRLGGRYHQLARFFYNVSRLERAISMENIQLTEPTASGDDTLLRVDVLATTYRRPSDPEVASAGAAPGTGG